MRIDFGRIMDYEDEICSYEGFLPLLLRAPFMKEHAKTLERAGLYDDVVAEEIMSRPMGFEEAVDEAVRWCREKGVFVDIILDGQTGNE